MANPRIFISSTCYDLSMVREQLRNFILTFGYEPVMSEYSDILYDPRIHTHTSCINEIPNVDMIILLVGSRFGGQAVPEALSTIDIDNLIKERFDTSVLEKPDKLSVTQLEVLKAIEYSIPVFAFVDENVMHDHFVYKKNKLLSNQIQYPSIEKQETAEYIFEFIDFLKHRNVGNNLIQFSKIEDIENHLRKQWASLFQRLLKDQRNSSIEHSQMFAISEQIEEIKTAVLSSIGNKDNRDVARGTIKYRRLVDFISKLNNQDVKFIYNTELSFDDFIKNVGIVQIENMPVSRGPLGRTALIKEDGTFYEFKFPKTFINRLADDWQSYIKLRPDVREVIYEAINDLDQHGLFLVRYRNEQYTEYIKQFNKTEKDDEEEEFTFSEEETTNSTPKTE